MKTWIDKLEQSSVPFPSPPMSATEDESRVSSAPRKMPTTALSFQHLCLLLALPRLMIANLAPASVRRFNGPLRQQTKMIPVLDSMPYAARSTSTHWNQLLREYKAEAVQGARSAASRVLADGITFAFHDVPRCGSYNIIYPLPFSNGVKWLVRIPGRGQIFQGLHRVRMDSEYQTMRYVRANTSIPLPEIYYLGLPANEGGSAFALIEHLPGRPLSDVWEVFTQRQRLGVLKGNVKVMAQLQFCHFDKLGMLRFYDEGKPAGIDSEILLPNEVGAATP